MAACSGDQLVNDAEQKIQSESNRLQLRPVVQMNTRATSITTATLPAFDVKIDGNFQKGEIKTEKWTAADIQTITRAGSSWVFPTDVQYWWADKVTPAKFTAWAPIDWVKAGTDLSEGANITVADDIKSQVDYLVAYNEGLREDFDAGVPINFQHVLSQIVVRALNKNPEVFNVRIAGIKLMNAANSNSMKMPAISTVSPFDWDSYAPYAAAPTGKAGYVWGNTSAVSVSEPTLLTSAASQLSEPMLLMPQTLTECKLDQTVTPMTGNYLAVLVQVKTVNKVTYYDPTTGQAYLDNNGGKGAAVPFDGLDQFGNETNLYTADMLAQLKTGALADGRELYKEIKTVYPTQGYFSNNDYYAYVGVDIGGLTWKPGYKYTYTLNFSKDGIGKSIADQPTDSPTDGNFPFGLDPETGDPKQPGEDIVDNPTRLFFTVTVAEWEDGDPLNKNM